MPANRKITKTMYDCVKTLLKGGASNKEAADFMNISDETVRRIKNTENYEDYEQSCAAMRAFYTKRAREKKEAEKAKYQAPEAKVITPVPGSVIKLPQHNQITPVSGEEGYRIVNLLKEQNELLKLISNKLGFIVDELTMPVKKEVQEG